MRTHTYTHMQLCNMPIVVGGDSASAQHDMVLNLKGSNTLQNIRLAELLGAKKSACDNLPTCSTNHMLAFLNADLDLMNMQISVYL